MPAGTTAFSPATAPAAYGCNGSRIDGWNSTCNGPTYATTPLFRDGTCNRVAAVKRGSCHGVESRIAVQARTNTDGYVGEDDGGA
ncbi:hypothetical protein [Streptomyces incanus]|uniref:DUF2282 domain-containing protein n=1 Tax=Streptomyces incanus TaxID=887453 RepID=A0ABW0XMS3_9ACTN